MCARSPPAIFYYVLPSAHSLRVPRNLSNCDGAVPVPPNPIVDILPSDTLCFDIHNFMGAGREALNNISTTLSPSSPPGGGGSLGSRPAPPPRHLVGMLVLSQPAAPARTGYPGRSLPSGPQGGRRLPGGGGQLRPEGADTGGYHPRGDEAARGVPLLWGVPPPPFLGKFMFRGVCASFLGGIGPSCHFPLL